MWNDLRSKPVLANRTDALISFVSSGVAGSHLHSRLGSPLSFGRRVLIAVVFHLPFVQAVKALAAFAWRTEVFAGRNVRHPMFAMLSTGRPDALDLGCNVPHRTSGIRATSEVTQAWCQSCACGRATGEINICPPNRPEAPAAASSTLVRFRIPSGLASR